MPDRSETNRWTTFQFQLARPVATAAGNSWTAALNSARCAWPRTGGAPGLLENQGPWPAHTEAAAHWPMVCGSRPKVSTVEDAVHPWAKSHMACHRSRGVGARISRLCIPETSNHHRSKSAVISRLCGFHLGFGLVGEVVAAVLFFVRVPRPADPVSDVGNLALGRLPDVG